MPVRIVTFAPSSVMPELYQSYMSFIQGGGIFVPTTDNYAMGEQCLLVLKLPEHDELTIPSLVVWITVRGPAGGRERFRGGSWKQGVGLRFTGPSGVQAKAVIDKMLGRNLSSTQPTLTF